MKCQTALITSTIFAISISFVLSGCNDHHKRINEKLYIMLDDLTTYTEEQAELAFVEKYKNKKFRVFGTISELERSRVVLHIYRKNSDQSAPVKVVISPPFVSSISLHYLLTQIEPMVVGVIQAMVPQRQYRHG